MGMRPGYLEERKEPPSLTAAGARPNAGARGCLPIFYYRAAIYSERRLLLVVRMDTVSKDGRIT